MLCKFCGADLGTRPLKFCMRCGAPLQTAPAEQIAATPLPDNESTVRMTARNMPGGTQKPLPALQSFPKTSRFLQEPISAASPRPDALAVDISIAPTMIFSGKDKFAEFELLQEPGFAAPAQPDVLMVDTSIAPTMIFSGNKAQQVQSKRQNRKARGQARRAAQASSTPTEPFIPAFPAMSAVQNEPPEPTMPPAVKAFPPILLENDERIAADLLSGPSNVPPQAFREGIHPALPVIAIFVLIVCLGGFFLWNSGETAPSPENAETSLAAQPSEPAPDVGSPPFSPAPVSELKDTSALNPEMEPEQEADLMDIPSLPSNQQQGRHNQFNPIIIIESEKPSVTPQPAAPKQINMPGPVTMPRAIEMPKPGGTPESVETTIPDEIDILLGIPARESDITDSRPPNPVWLEQMREDLSNCPNVFCRERVRDEYCSAQWKSLPECKGASL